MNAVSTKVLLRFFPPVCPFDQGKNNNNNSPHATPPPKRKNTGPPRVHVEPSHWLHEISFSKIVGHHFLLELMVVTLVIEQIKVNLKHNW
jgi:hypothetical protein